MTKTYTVVKFDLERTVVGKYASYAAAAAVLRKLSAEYFVQGPKQAWFYEDVTR